jgi:tetratricopeptide (TPR) repeat protein
MTAPEVGVKGLIPRPLLADRRLSSRRTATLLLLFLPLAMQLVSGCSVPSIVRVPVPSEDIIRANEAAREADLAFARKDYYAALIKYLEAARLNPNSEFICNKLGITYSQLKYYADAAGAFERSIGLNPKYPYSYNNLGTVHFVSGSKKTAEKYFRKAISLSPNSASFHINLGTLYFEMGKLQKGMAALRKGLAIDPAIMGKSESISLSAAGASRSPIERAYFLARLFASMGDAERAVENLKQALNAGFMDFDAIRKEPDFDPIREDQRFVAFMKTAAVLAKP